MTERWTPEQLNAITCRDSRLLVAAAAGAGKTAVLVERIIRRITDPANPVDVDRLLVVTFTNAAAAEMRERIGLAINRALESDPGSGLLRRQLALLQRASISTMHSFCLELIRQHFYRLELDPVFRVADDAESALLQLDVLEAVFESRYAAGDQHFLALADCYGGHQDDTGLQELVLELYKFSRSTPWPGQWLRRLPDWFNLPENAVVDDLPWFNILKESIKNELAGVRGMLEQAGQLARRPGGPGPYQATLQEDLLLVDDLIKASSISWDKLHRQFSATVFSKLASCKKNVADENLKKTAQKLRNAAKERVQKMRGRYFNRPAAQLLIELRQMVPLLGALAGLVEQFAGHYRQVKLDRGVVDFSDLEHYALQILQDMHGAAGNGVDSATGGGGVLCPSAVALELQERFAEVLVDEYQDINAVQETILNLVSGAEGHAGSGLFMVGDVKQSIYRFRLAEPGLFMDKYHRYAAGDGGRLINLARNFRSRRGVVNAVNFIFGQIMSPAVGEMTYDTQAELIYGAGYPPRPGVVDDHCAQPGCLCEATTDGDPACGVKGPGQPGETVELHLIETEQEQDIAAEDEDFSASGDGEDVPGADSEEDLDALRMEAGTVAQRITQMVEEGWRVYDREQNGYRTLNYRDVVVLLRATTGRANVFLEEFGKLGIPAYAELNTGYFEATEVETILALLKIIDNPRQDVPLAAVLRSPLVGLKSEDLAQIRLCGGPGDFYDAVVLSTLEGPKALIEPLVRFLQQLERWRTMARRGSLAELLWTLYRETGYYDFVGGLPGGGQRQANLRALYHRARQYESTAYRGLFRFMRFIQRIRDNSGDMGAARALGENENVVRIMSIHKSKGLEFPVVIVAGLGKRFNLRDLNKGVLMHRKLGLGPQLVDAEKRIAYPTVAKLAVRDKLRAEALAEEMRVLYVAMTRAREKLILVGAVRGLRDSSTRWCAAAHRPQLQLPPWLTAGARHYLDWLCPALARHHDGAPLRALSGIIDEAQLSLDHSGLAQGGEPAQLAFGGDPSRWRVFVWDSHARQRKADAPPTVDHMEHVRRLEPVPGDGPLVEQVKARLNWRYPHQHWQGLAARATVTGLKGTLLHGEMVPGVQQQNRDFQSSLSARPLFVQKSTGLTAAERGQALHLVMQLLDLRGKLDIIGISEQIAAMVEQEKLSRAQASVVLPEAVACFWGSPLGQRILKSNRVYRELPFTLALPVQQVYPQVVGNAGSDETVLVQGIIDCLADEGAGLLLVDYKTDRYTRATLMQKALRYGSQLELYIRAAEIITGRRVTAAYLYMFYGGDVLAYAKGQVHETSG
ncbi:UvrD-helicase domain-containing protein [Desulfoscipio gibsoniae]|uniref:ATP-dependent helicase/nuclease subunit A n=1 Tax=Desulfoscipio gibsoniae DSM 7213 TaxID=767817 RepID=R4KKD3_9FIRM|nr:UvrD-helicase domain-containing protein [Desulfoscipio gibsoniae]AGL03114.1 ATP-dependent exonuclase V beta subunit, helicase and exonuclease domain-containing [Desulfoscipio gibsoniae DSM 7213]